MADRAGRVLGRVLARRVLARRVLAAAAAAAALGGAAAAQQQVVACPSQAEVEQAVTTGSAPEGCRSLTMTVVESEAGALCAVDIAAALGGLGEGLTGALAGDALPEEWWVPCDQVAVGQ